MKPSRSQQPAAAVGALKQHARIPSKVPPLGHARKAAATAAPTVAAVAADPLLPSDGGGCVDGDFAFNDADFVFDAPCYVDLAKEFSTAYDEEEYVFHFHLLSFHFDIRSFVCLRAFSLFEFSFFVCFGMEFGQE